MSLSIYNYLNLSLCENWKQTNKKTSWSLWLSAYRHSEKDPSEVNEDSSSKRHKKKKKKKKRRREDEDRPHTGRDVALRREDRDSRGRNGSERGSQHHSSASLHSVHRHHMKDQQHLNGQKGALLLIA